MGPETVPEVGPLCGWVWVGVGGCGWVWCGCGVGVGGCGWCGWVSVKCYASMSTDTC